MPTFTALIQHGAKGSNQSNKERNEKKSHIDQKGRCKIALCADDIIVYIENPKKSTKKYSRTNVNSVRPQKTR